MTKGVAARRLLVGLWLAVTPAALAQDVKRIYADSDLQEAAGRMRPNLLAMWEEDFLSRLTSAERSRAGTIQFHLPLVGAHSHPVDFYADVPQRRVFIPIASVKFIDDLSIASAYFTKHGCDMGAVSDYAGMLRERPGSAAGSPRDALGLPSSVLDDAFVDDVSAKLTKSVVFFVMAHEFAHVMHRHRPYGDITAVQAQAQEMEADAFALDVMRRIGVPPIGLAHFFVIMARMERSPGDFDSPAEYERYLAQRSTHPLSARRILQVGNTIDLNIDDFVRLEPKPAGARAALEKSAAEVKKIAQSLDDRRMRIFLAERARNLESTALQSACRR